MCYRLWEAVELHRDIMLRLSAVILQLCNNLTPQWSNAQKTHTPESRQLHVHMDRLTHAIPKEAWPEFYVTRLPLCQCSHPPPPALICLLGLTWWAWCHFPFLSLKNRRTNTGLCVCALMWAIAKCFYNDVMLLLCSPPAPPSLRLPRSLRRGHTQKQTQVKPSVHNEQKGKWMMAFTQP